MPDPAATNCRSPGRSNDLEKGTGANENRPVPVADCHATPLTLASAILAA